MKLDQTLDKLRIMKGKTTIHLDIKISDQYREELLKNLKDKFKVEEEKEKITISDASQKELIKRIIEHTQGCFYLRIRDNSIEIEEIKCPPCEEGSATKLETENTCLLPDGKFLVIDNEKQLRIYKCRIRL